MAETLMIFARLTLPNMLHIIAPTLSARYSIVITCISWLNGKGLLKICRNQKAPKTKAVGMDTNLMQMGSTYVSL